MSTALRVHIPILATLALFVVPVRGGETLILANARVVDPVTATISLTSVSVVDGLVAELDASAAETTTFDLEGRWLVPGFHDLHVHAYGNANPAGPPEIMGIDGVARRMLAAGVTAFLDLANFEKLIFDLRDEQRTTGVEGAAIYAAGTSFTCPGGHGTEYPNPARVVESPASAERSVGELLARRPDVVKVIYDPSSPRFPSMDYETLLTLTSTASAAGVAVVAHIDSWQDALDAARAGVSAITHVDSTPVPAGLIELLLERRVAVIPTLAVQTELAGLLADPSTLDDALLRRLAHPELIAAYRDPRPIEQRFAGWLEDQRAARAGYLAAAAAFVEAGVPVLVGTDAGNPGTFQGYSVHREMALLVEAGLTPWQALRAATVDAGEFLGRSIGFSPGSQADFVVLDASPIEDITNTQRIHAVVQAGHWIRIDDPSETP